MRDMQLQETMTFDAIKKNNNSTVTLKELYLFMTKISLMIFSALDRVNNLQRA